MAVEWLVQGPTGEIRAFYRYLLHTRQVPVPLWLRPGFGQPPLPGPAMPKAQRTTGEAVPKLVRIWYEAGTATTRRNGEGNPKPPRSPPEADPKTTRSRPEAHPKKMHSDLGMDSTNFQNQGKTWMWKGDEAMAGNRLLLKEIDQAFDFRCTVIIAPADLYGGNLSTGLEPVQCPAADVEHAHHVYAIDQVM
jgi:hypothetical protein